MQNMNHDFGFSTQDDTTQSRNLAAIALAEAMNRARTLQTGRDSAKSDIRAGAVTRLEALRKKLAPLYSAIPHDVELFDLGLVSHEKPRLFVDIIAFIELNRDQTGFRFLQETRAGRLVLAETEDEKHLVNVVTDYVAHRLIERERALSADDTQAPINTHKTATSSASSHAHSAVSSTLPELDSTHDEIAEAHDEAVLKRGNEPSITAAEAFRQWSPSSVITTPSVEPLSPVEQLVNAHQAAADMKDRRLQSVEIAQEKAVLDKAGQENLAYGDLARQQTTSVSETIRPLVASQAKSAIDSALHASSDKATVAVHLATDPLLNVAVTPSVNEVAGFSLHDPVAEGQGAAINRTSSVQTSATRTVAGLAATAAAGVAATAANTRKANTIWTPGWWIWPLLALLLGVGLGALMLYVYAANLVR
jgi:hypothetical protein